MIGQCFTPYRLYFSHITPAENVKSLQTDGRRTTGDRKSSFELSATCNILKKKTIISDELDYCPHEADSVAIVQYILPKLRLLLTRRGFLAYLKLRLLMKRKFYDCRRVTTGVRVLMIRAPQANIHKQPFDKVDFLDSALRRIGKVILYRYIYLVKQLLNRTIQHLRTKDGFIESFY